MSISVPACVTATAIGCYNRSRASVALDRSAGAAEAGAGDPYGGSIGLEGSWWLGREVRSVRSSFDKSGKVDGPDVV